MAARSGDAGTTQDPLHARTRECDAFTLAQQVSEVAVVEAVVPLSPQRHDPRDQVRVEPVRWDLAAVAMRERTGTRADEATPQPPQLPR